MKAGSEGETTPAFVAGLIVVLGALLAVAVFWAAPAHAGAPRYHPHTFTVSTAACPTGTPGVDTDGVQYGISLAGLRAWTVEMCPVTAGDYFTSTGVLHVCVYSQTEWGSGSWALAFDLDPGVEDYSTTADNPCRRWPDIEVGVGLADRVFVFPSTDFGLHSGTQARLRFIGESR